VAGLLAYLAAGGGVGKAFGRWVLGIGEEKKQFFVSV
jgi:hypothetical protein